MKIGLRILLGYLLVVGLAAWFLVNIFAEEVKPGVRDTLENTLVDTTNVLARMVAQDVKSGHLAQSALLQQMQGQRALAVNINGVVKKTFDFRITITNEHGIVLFDSSGIDIGKDYSRWNDISRTLHGKYGARSTRSDPNDPITSVMHIAAPIMDGDQLIGVLSVAKPVAAVQPIIERGQREILQRGGILLIGSLMIGFAFAYWLNRELRKLQSYAAQVEAGKKVSLPALGNHEIGTLGQALESMRSKLEGKKYVEELMHTLAHELKSPIAAIQGSAELLREEMPAIDRQHFLNNILEQNQRQKQLIEKLLALVAVEKQQQLTARSGIPLHPLITQVIADFDSKQHTKSIRIEIAIDDCELYGDALLLRQALGNLLDNALEFSPDHGVIRIETTIDHRLLTLTMTDHGPGIPDYALPRLFERFYSLPRPHGPKSTGLGLPFVREVVSLHGGSIHISNNDAGGACAQMQVPIG